MGLTTEAYPPLPTHRKILVDKIAMTPFMVYVCLPIIGTLD